MSIEHYQATFIQTNFADRIGGEGYGKDTSIYKFEKIKRAKASAKQDFPNIELIDMGVGEPDEMADEGIVVQTCEEAAKEENRGYSDNGIPEFKDAAAVYLKEVFRWTELTL